MSTDETRYVLNGVHLCRLGGHNIVTATDGRQMLVLTVSADTEPWPEGFQLTLVPKHVLTMWSAHGGPGDNLRIEKIDAKQVRVQGMIGNTKALVWEVVTECTDWVSPYPHWWKVLPEECPPEKRTAVQLSLDVERIDLIKTAFCAWLKRDPALTLHLPEQASSGHHGPIVVTAGRYDALALLMPIKCDPVPDRMPGFVMDVMTAGNSKSEGNKP